MPPTQQSFDVTCEASVDAREGGLGLDGGSVVAVFDSVQGSSFVGDCTFSGRLDEGVTTTVTCDVDVDGLPAGLHVTEVRFVPLISVREDGSVDGDARVVLRALIAWLAADVAS